MAYNANIPQPTDQLKVSQADLLANFQAINTFVNVNHEDFGSADQGKHKFLQMPEQGVAPATAADEAGLFGGEGAYSTDSELYFRRENNGDIIAFTEGLNTTPGWCRLPCGILVKWQLVSVPAQSGAISVSQSTPWTVAADIPPFGSAPFHYSTTVQQDLGNGLNLQAFINVDMTSNATTIKLRINSPFTVVPSWSAFKAYVIAFGLE